MYKFLTITLLIFVFMSCKTYDVMHFEVLRPAAYSVPPQIKTLVIVDNAYPFNPDDAHIAHVVGEEVRLDTVRVDSFAAVIAGNLQQELLRRRFFDTVYIDTVSYNTADQGQSLRALTPAQIIDIGTRHQADAVLSLAAASYGTDIKVEDMSVEYYAMMDVAGTVYWRLWDAYSATVLHQELQRDTLYWDGIGASIDASVMYFPSLKEATIELGSFLGATYADKLTPYWEPVERKVYTNGNPHFVSAIEWLNKDNRYEAEKMWGYVYAHGNSREKGKAAYNIAVSMELRGDLEQAVQWAYKSYEAFRTKGVVGSRQEVEDAKKLYQGLVIRYRDEKKLNEQVGGTP
ncbi:MULTISPECIES: DUF6340 family protein [unclassified Carboxylicivirga]|uniref:DUF6340 family protein n=1 Tax=Carboxylicivirga TaxID=1628153 RepID=UPI003D339BC7